MAKVSEDCIKEAFDALKHFDKKELEQYVRDVFVRAKEIDPLQGARAMDQATKEVNDLAAKSLFSDTAQKAKNIMAFEANANPIKEGKADLRGLLAGRSKKGSYLKRTDKDSDWRKRNIADSVKAEYEKAVQRIMDDMTHEEVEHFTSGEFDEQICDIFDGKKSNDEFSNKIAAKLKDYMEYARTQLILSGAMKPEEFHPRRYFSAVHDQQRIVNGSKSLIKAAGGEGKYNIKENKIGWRNFIKQYIDQYETFKKTKAADLKANIDEGAADKIIDKVYDDISTDRTNIFTRSLVANDREAVQRKSKMFFVWKDMRSLYEYNKVFGQGNLFAMLMRDAQSTSHKVGTAKVWGDNPYSMYIDLKKVQEQADPKGALWQHNTDNYFKSVMRLDRTDGSPNATNFFANARTVTTMARLPLITVDSISDVGYIAAFANRIGVNYFKAWTHHLSHIFDSFPTENRIKVAKLMRTQIDTELGYLGRWVEANNVTEGLNKVSTKFFKYNLLSAFDRGNKTGNMALMGESLFQHSSKKWDELPKMTKKYLDRFIDDKEWQLLRKKNNGKFFSTENVDNLSDAEIKAHYETTDKSIPLSEMRDDLYRRVYAMFTVNAENTVLSAGDFERAFMFQGTTPGTPTGIALRTISQFKMYTISYIDRVLIDGLRNADTVQQKLIWATTMMIGTLPLAVASMFFKNLSMGLTMPDVSQMNVPEREKFLIQLMAPSLGLFSGLLDQRNQNQSMLSNLIGSPSISLILNAMAIPLALGTGNLKHAAKETAKTAGYILPLQTTPFISPLIRQALGDEAHLEPGQQHIFGR